MALSRFSFPTAITFGPGARREVAAHLAHHGVKHPLIVTDRGLAARPLLAKIRAHRTHRRAIANPHAHGVLHVIEVFLVALREAK